VHRVWCTRDSSSPFQAKEEEEEEDNDQKGW
jgi:hypothetical protein